jgi:hypothetical protein
MAVALHPPALRAPSSPCLRQGCPRNGTRLRARYAVRRDRIPVAGLGPSTHVFSRRIAAGSRRGCPGQAWARAVLAQSSEENPRKTCIQIPRTALRLWAEGWGEGQSVTAGCRP